MILAGHNGSRKTVVWAEDVTSLATMNVDPKNMSNWQRYVNGLNSERTSWLGVSGGVPEVRRKVEIEGWSEGVEQAEKSIGEFEVPKLPHFKRKRVRAFQGHALDIHRVYSGDLQHAWEASKREVSNILAMKGHINIIIDIGANAGVSSRAFFWRGAVGCVLARALIASGRNVKIIAVECTSDVCTQRNYRAADKVVIATVLKGFEDSLELNRLFSATALSGFYRYYYFKAILSAGFEATHGFGRAVKFDPDDLNYFLDDTPCLIISNIWNKEQAKYKLQRLSKQIEGSYNG